MDELHPKIPQADPRDLPSLAWDGERYELFDLVADPGELSDLFETRRSSTELTELTNALRPYLAEEDTPGVLSKELIKALENAGYLR